MITRRQWLCGMGAMAGAAARPAHAFTIGGEEVSGTLHHRLELSEFEPISMLKVRESRIERARFPVIDFHTHISCSAKSQNGVAISAERRYPSTPESLVAVMDRKNTRTFALW
jgi:hypothetical protein